MALSGHRRGRGRRCMHARTHEVKNYRTSKPIIIQYYADADTDKAKRKNAPTHTGMIEPTSKQITLKY